MNDRISDDITFEELKALLAEETARRQKAEAEVQRLNQIIHILGQKFLDGAIAVFDQDLRTIFVETAGLALLGLSPEHVMGKSPAEFLPPDLYNLMSTQLHAALKGETVIWEFNSNLPLENHSRFYMSPLVNPDGSNGVLLITQNITAQKQLENALRQSESRYLAVIEAQTEYICRYTPDLNITFANSRYCQMYDLDPHTIIGKNLADIIPSQETVERLRQGTANQAYMEAENNTVLANGEIAWQSWVEQPIFDEDDNLIEYQGVGHDITAQKRAEQLLRDSEEFVQKIARTIPDIIYVFDIVEQRNIYSNRQIAEVLGYSSEQIQNMGSALLPMLIHPEDLPDLLTHFQESSTMVDGDIIETTYRIQSASGELRWLHTRETVFSRSSSGQVLQLLGIAEDITERKQLEQEHLQLKLEKKSSRLLADFIQNTSHDFRTPLTIISTSLYLLRKVTDNPEKSAHRIDVIEDQIARLDQMIGQLHELSRLDNDLPLQLSIVDINTLLKDVTAKFEDRIAIKKQHLHFDFATLSVFRADETQLHRAFTRLLENAIIFTPDEGDITLCTRKVEGGIVIEIRDTGMGIASEDLPHIFERFYKADAARTAGYGGAGIGLSVADKVIEKHGGRIEVASVVDQGSTFLIWLPV